MRSRLSANLGFLWRELPLLARIDAAAWAGFEAVELHWPYDVPATAVRAACARHRVRLLGLNTPVGTRAGDFGLAAVPDREEEFRAAFEQALAYALAAEATSIHVMAGNVGAEARQQAAEAFMRRLRWAELQARPHGVTLLIEPINRIDQPDYFLTTVDQGAALLAQMDGTEVRLMFDCYHVARETGDVLRRLSQYRDLIGHVQVAAVPSRAEPDEGEICYRAIFEQLERLAYPGFVGCEYRPRAAVEDGLGWIEAIAVPKN